MADALRHGTVRHGERQWGARLTAAKVREIDGALRRGETQQALADKYGVSSGTIGDIDRGRTWVRVTGRTFKPGRPGPKPGNSRKHGRKDGI